MKKVAFSVFSAVFFASQSVTKEPWYFEPNDLQEAHTINQGEYCVVVVVDTPVHFRECISGKDMTSSYVAKNDGFTMREFLANYNKTIFHPLYSAEGGYAVYIHGTSMASLIASREGCSVINELDHQENITISGIAPKSKIFNLAWGVDFSEHHERAEKIMYGNTKDSLFGALDKVWNQIQDLKEVPNFNKKSKIKIFVVNISAEEHKSSSVTERGIQRKQYEQWFDLLTEANDILPIVAAGNSHQNLDKDCTTFPVCLALSLSQQDKIIRVGGVAPYNKTLAPQLWVESESGGSNYGNRYVDILAPAQAIPTMTPPSGGYGITHSGTSQATAIVSGAAALLASCDPTLSASQVKMALLEQADSYKHLKNKAKDGKVLNIGKVIKAYCLHHEKNEPYHQRTKSSVKDEL